MRMRHGVPEIEPTSRNAALNADTLRQLRS